MSQKNDIDFVSTPNVCTVAEERAHKDQVRPDFMFQQFKSHGLGPNEWVSLEFLSVLENIIVQALNPAF